MIQRFPAVLATLMLLASAAVAQDVSPVTPADCPSPAAFWLENPAEWTVAEVTVGGTAYPAADLQELLRQIAALPPEDLTPQQRLAQNLVTYHLNVAKGYPATPEATAAATEADTLLQASYGGLPDDSPMGEDVLAVMESLALTMESYNLCE